jgi:hypothetical protein
MKMGKQREVCDTGGEIDMDEEWESEDETEVEGER